MKISYREPNHKINQGKKEGLVSILYSVFLITIAVFIGAWILRGVIAAVAPRIPFEYELALRGMISSIFGEKVVEEDSELNRYLEQIVKEASSQAEVDLPQIKVRLACLGFENAFALPGVEILITGKLIEALDHEAELFMVLSHEVGHLVNRDNMRMLGSAFFDLAFIAVVSPFLVDGAETVVNLAQLLSSTSYSRAQELAADRYGVKALLAKYGEISGAIQVFMKFEEFEKREVGEESGIFDSIISTHPHSSERIRQIELEASKNDWPISNAVRVDLDWLKTQVRIDCAAK